MAEVIKACWDAGVKDDAGGKSLIDRGRQMLFLHTPTQCNEAITA